MVKELTPKKPRELTQEEEEELVKTLKFSNSRLFDAFNVAKSIWNLAYDNIDLYIKKNRKTIATGHGYVFYYNKIDTKLFVWEYEIKKTKGDNGNHKTYLTPIYDGSSEDLLVPDIIETFSTWNQTEYFKSLPIFEIQSSQNFPMEQTLVPMIKRKITSYIFQIVNAEKFNNFDFKL